MQKIHVLSFKDLKQRVSIEQVLRHYDLFDGLHLRGKSHRGPCPFCEVTEGNPFSVSLEKNCYQCFSCKASGNILDFVAQWEGITIREASQVLTKNFMDGKAPHEPAKAVKQEAPPAKEAGGPAGEASERTTVAPRATPTAAAVDDVPQNQNEPPSRNEPLTFTLKNSKILIQPNRA